MNTNHYSIGGLAKKAGCKVETVHYYEKIYLMPEEIEEIGYPSFSTANP